MRTPADDAEIRTLIAQVAHLADEGTLEDYGAAFTSDVSWEMGANPAVDLPAKNPVIPACSLAGTADRRAKGIGGPGSNMRHTVSTVAIEFDTDDRARVVAYWMFWGDTTTAPRLVSMGRYDNLVVRTEIGWRIKHRKITIG
jgi:3-phenylpropionate/cinnamic acid dioxygenase small subunit